MTSKNTMVLMVAQSTLKAYRTCWTFFFVDVVHFPPEAENCAQLSLTVSYVWHRFPSVALSHYMWASSFKTKINVGFSKPKLWTVYEPNGVAIRA